MHGRSGKCQRASKSLDLKLGCRKLTPDFRMTGVLTILPSRLGGLEMGTDLSMVGNMSDVGLHGLGSKRRLSCSSSIRRLLRPNRALTWAEVSVCGARVMDWHAEARCFWKEIWKRDGEDVETRLCECDACRDGSCVAMPFCQASGSVFAVESEWVKESGCGFDGDPW